MLRWFEAFAAALASGKFGVELIAPELGPVTRGISLFPRQPPECSVAVTRGVRVTACPLFVPEQAKLDKDAFKQQYLFCYRWAGVGQGVVRRQGCPGPCGPTAAPRRGVHCRAHDSTPWLGSMPACQLAAPALPIVPHASWALSLLQHPLCAAARGGAGRALARHGRPLPPLALGAAAEPTLGDAQP